MKQLQSPASDSVLNWQHPLYKLLTSTTLSAFAGQIYALILPFIVLQVTGSALSMGIAAAAERLSLMLQPLFGPIVDRLQLKPLLLFCDLGRFALTLLLAYMFMYPDISVLFVYLIVFFIGTMNQLYQAAQFSAIPNLVNQKDLHYANSIESSIFQLAVLLGPSLGGMIISLFNPTLAAITVSIAFLFAAIAVMGIPVLASSHTRRLRFTFRTYITELNTGFYYLYQNKSIWYTNLTVLMSNFGIQFLIVLQIFYLRDALLVSPFWIGIILSSGGIGAIFGTYIGYRLEKILTRKQLLIIARIAGGISIIAVGLGANPLLLALFNLIGTAGAGAVNPVVKTIRQEHTPKNMLASVQSSSRFLTFSLLPAASLAAGFLAEQIGSGHAIAFGGIIVMAANLVFLLRGCRQLKL